MIHTIYCNFDLLSQTNETYQRFFNYLPYDRMQKVQRYRNETDKSNCVMSYMLIMYSVYKTFGIVTPEIASTKYGKLYLVDYPEAHFNISHCAKGCVCAVSDYEIGIDIQDVRPFSWSVVNHCCSAKEKQLLRNCIDPTAEFTKIWTMKESYLKMKGTGITVDLCAVDTTKLRDRIKTFEINGCYISVASAKSFPEEEICLN